MLKDHNLLSVRNLKTYFHTRRGPVKAVDGVDLDIGYGELVGVVGETGCGKSVTGLSVMRLVASPPGEIMDGQVIFEDEDLLKISESEMRKVRGNDIAMIFQEPGSSLNPVFNVADQIAEAIELHQGLDANEAREKAKEMMHLVGVPDVEKRARNYPHQFSGGMNQRIMIAMALSCNPKLLIADEPVTALDVTIQAQILNLLVDLRNDLGTSVWLITHDLGVIAQTCEQVKVMYMGKIVEAADVHTIFEKPLHPYTEGLLKSVPRPDMEQQDLAAIPGTVPSPHDLPTGCKFNTRCYLADEECEVVEPQLLDKEPGHSVACLKR